MPEEEKKIEPMVDIDTSGPEVEVNLEEENKVEEPKETLQVEETEPKEEIKVEEETKETEVKEETEDKKKELEDYSDGVQKRIAKLTKKWREAERQKDEAVSYAQNILRKQKDAESKLSKLQPDFVAVTEESINSGVAAAQAKLAAAREANDLKAESEALASISELGYKRAKLEETKLAQAEFEKYKTESKPDVNLTRQTAAKGTPDPKAESWAAKNSWFGQDTAMTYTAFDLHKKLTEEEGFDPTSDEYYSEIDKRIRLEFPHKFDKKENTETTKPVQTVASAKRSTKSGRKTVRLTPSQVAIAKKLGVPLEEYAKQLKLTKEV